MKEKPKVTVQPSATNKPFDFYAQIEADYGIKKTGDKEFQVEVNGVKHVGSLSSIMSIAKGETTASLWGNP